MAVRANFDFDIRFGRAGLDHISASAANGRFNVLRMNSVFHKNS
jgi:hypothetical protein